MTLQQCRVCGEQVAARARTCPHCGEPNPTDWAQKDARRGLAIGAALFAAFALGWTILIANCTVGAFG